MSWARKWCILLLLAAGCSGLGGEPQIVATLPPAAQVPQEARFPARSPDMANGARIYANRCAGCHGTGGAGDGAMVTSGRLAVDGQVIQPASFIDPATARDQTPQEWFDVITNGRIERLMPPWADALTEQERWDVAYFTYTLHYTSEQIARGREIWKAECTDCHGLEGRGDGPEAADVRKQVDDLTDQYEMAISSDRVLYNFVNEGAAEAMPAFGDTLSETQMWDVVTFSRTLSLSNADVIGQPIAAPAATEESSASIPTPAVAVTLAAETTGMVTGRITNGTAGASLPGEMVVTLFVVDPQFNTQRFETTSDAEGNFTFSDVPVADTYSYATTVTYRERPFASEVMTGGATSVELPITIYELTEDPAVITITGLVHQVSALGDGLQVVQVMIFRNESDRMFTSGRTVGENRYASVIITLPPGAAILGFGEGQERYVVSDDQSTVIDTVPIVPGRDHIVQIIYLLPYNGSAIIEQPLNYALNGPVRLLLRPDTVTASSEQLPSIGPQEVGGVLYRGYGADLTLNPGDTIRYELSGAGAPGAAQLEPQVVSSNNLIVIAALALVGLAVVIGALYRVSRRLNPASEVDKQALIDALVRQIAELDEAEERGEINHDLYHHQRKQLKARLAELMEEDKP